MHGEGPEKEAPEDRFHNADWKRGLAGGPGVSPWHREIVHPPKTLVCMSYRWRNVWHRLLRDCATHGPYRDFRRRVPAPLQGVIIDEIKLSDRINVPLRNGMTEARVVAYTEETILRATALVNFRPMPTRSISPFRSSTKSRRYLGGRDPGMLSVVDAGVPDARCWLQEIGRKLTHKETAKPQGWPSGWRISGSGWVL